MDEVDHAQDLSQLHASSALARHLSQPKAAWRTACADCGEPISRQRIAANPHAQRCAFCQSQAEGESDG